ncbi:hypothetical protein FRB99_002579 [Tulasnella sp. 403]|nr:hypothetical protein FRB99_002579 [Tulasnella sp. 403]
MQLARVPMLVCLSYTFPLRFADHSTLVSPSASITPNISGTAPTLSPTSSSPSTSTAFFSSTSPSESSAPAGSHSSSSNTGPIVGAAIGGVLCGSAILGAVFFVRRRRRTRKGTTESLPIPRSAELYTPRGLDAIPRGWNGAPEPASYAGHEPETSSSMQSVVPKLYDPSDPSTFPPVEQSRNVPVSVSPSLPAYQASALQY